MPVAARRVAWTTGAAEPCFKKKMSLASPGIFGIIWTQQTIGGSMRLLVVERERMFAEALTTFLAGQDDIDVVGTAHSAAEAMALAAIRHPQVITTSFVLPDGDAAQLAISVQSQLDDVKIVIVSAFEQEAVVIAAVEAGCSGFVPKSAHLSDVAAAARAVMMGQVVIPPALITRVLGPSRHGPRRHDTSLTAVELEILKLFPEGLPDREIGNKLGLSERSVRNHVQSILVKLQCHSKLEGLATAIRRGIIFLSIP